MTKSDSESLQLKIGQATRLLVQGDHAAAASFCHKALQAHPHALFLHIRFGQALQGLAQMEAAAQCFQRALQINPDCTEASLLLGSLLLQTGCRDQAVSIYRHLLQREPHNVQAHVGLGMTYLQLGQADEASACSQTALAISPDSVDAIALAADIDEKEGRLKQALHRLRPLIHAGITNPYIVLTYAGVCRSQKTPEEAIDALESLLDSSRPLSPGECAGIHFVLGELCDSVGDYETAFEHYTRGNTINKRGFDRSQPEHDVNAMTKLYTADYLKRMARADNRSELPVFIVGMHRSGTSLVEQILACHPDVHGAGELPDIMQMVSSLHSLLGSDCRNIDCLPMMTKNVLDLLSEKHLARLASLGGPSKRVVDKMPGNFMYLGFIQQMFPGARIIHCIRNPLDTCLSTYFQNFGGAQTYMNDLGDLGYVYRCYHRMMVHWQKVLRLPVLQIQYEELVARPGHVIRELVAFCGLPWCEQCLSFHSSERFVNTASYDQVRQPMYTRSVKRWEHYKKHLGPLREALGDLL